MLTSILFVSLATSAPVRENIKLLGGCVSTEYGCCPDRITPRNNTAGTNCIINPTGSTKQELLGGCVSTEYGCCGDNYTPRIDINGTNC